MSNSNVAKVLILGRTGVGKSSFINYLLDNESAKVGVGEPITQDMFTTYEYKDENGMKLNVVDTKGIEVKDANKYVPKLVANIKMSCRSNDPRKWYHTIFYCVSMNNQRFEPFEIQLINDLSRDINQNIHIILTHYKENESEKADKMEKCISSQIDISTRNNVKFYRVCSINKKTRGGEIKKYGREKVVDSIFETFFSDVAKKVATQYVNEAYSIYEKLIDGFEDEFIKFIEENVSVSKFKDFNNIKVNMKRDEILNLIKTKHKCELVNLKSKYNKSMLPIQEIYNSYKSILDRKGSESVNLDNIFNIIYPFDERMFDIDEIFQKSDLGKLVKKLDKIAIEEFKYLEYMKFTERTKLRIEKAKIKLKTRRKIFSIQKEIIGVVEVMFKELRENFNKSSVETRMYRLLYYKLLSQQLNYLKADNLEE